MYSLILNLHSASRRLASSKVAPNSARRKRIPLLFSLACIGVSLSTSAWCRAPDESRLTGGGQCMGFIMTGRPGGDAGVPYGAHYPILAEAEQDAINRCSQTNLAKEEGSAEVCKTWCIHD